MLSIRRTSQLRWRYAHVPLGFSLRDGFISYVHDITNNGFTVGDTINSATLNIFLTDVGGSESFTSPLLWVETQTETNIDPQSTEIIVLSAASKADLQADGLIGVKIEVQI